MFWCVQENIMQFILTIRFYHITKKYNYCTLYNTIVILITIHIDFPCNSYKWLSKSNNWGLVFSIRQKETVVRLCRNLWHWHGDEGRTNLSNFQSLHHLQRQYNDNGFLIKLYISTVLCGDLSWMWPCLKIQ